MISINDIREGDVIVVHKSKIKGIGDIPAPVIRALTECYWNHNALVVCYLDELYIAEAVNNGFVPTTRLEDYLKRIGNEIEIAILRSPSFQIDEFNYNLRDVVNHAYGFGTLIFQQLIYQLTKKAFTKGWWLGKTGESAKHTVVCSEVICYAYPEIYDNTFAYKTTPKDIWEGRSKGMNLIWESNAMERIIFENKYN